MAAVAECARERAEAFAGQLPRNIDCDPACTRNIARPRPLCEIGGREAVMTANGGFDLGNRQRRPRPDFGGASHGRGEHPFDCLDSRKGDVTNAKRAIDLDPSRFDKLTVQRVIDFQAL